MHHFIYVSIYNGSIIVFIYLDGILFRCYISLFHIYLYKNIFSLFFIFFMLTMVTGKAYFSSDLFIFILICVSLAIISLNSFALYVLLLCYIWVWVFELELIILQLSTDTSCVKSLRGDFWQECLYANYNHLNMSIFRVAALMYLHINEDTYRLLYEKCTRIYIFKCKIWHLPNFFVIYSRAGYRLHFKKNYNRNCHSQVPGATFICAYLTGFG